MSSRTIALCIIVFVALPLLLLAATLRVKSVSPTLQSLTAGLTSEIKIEFETPMNRATITARSIMIFGRWTGVMPGEFRFEDSDRLIRFLPAKKFSAGELITVAISKRVKSANGDSLANGYTWNFWTAAGRGEMTLKLKSVLAVRFANEQKVRTYGAYAGDLNGDGYHDFTVPNEEAHDIRVFMNDGKGNYSYSSRYQLPIPATPSTNEGADFNSDGLIDFAVGNIHGNSVSVLLGDGRGGFLAPVTYPVGREPRGLTVMDLEGDGDMDIVTANRVGNNISILYNNGNGSFAPSFSFDSGGENETACAAADADEDGILDLFVGAFGSREIILLLGDGKGGLKFSTKIDSKGRPWMVAVGDVDSDGHVDAVAANAFEKFAAVIRSDGKGNLLPTQTYPVGDFPLAIDLGDLNGDGDLDLISSNYNSNNWTLYENSGNGTFVNPQSFPATTAASCAVFHDRDLDGDLDMTGIDEEADMIFLFENGAATAVNEKEVTELPQDFNLEQAYPNPIAIATAHKAANAGMTIPITLQRFAHVNLRVINLAGQTVEVLVDRTLSPGTHEVKFAAHLHAPGIYFCVLTVHGNTMTKKIMMF